MELDLSKCEPYDVVHGKITKGQLWQNYCTKCGKDLGEPTEYRFFSQKGKCDCCWKCCDAAMPPNKNHGEHRAYRLIE